MPRAVLCRLRCVVLAGVSACGGHGAEPAPVGFDASIADASGARDAALTDGADAADDHGPTPDPSKLMPSCLSPTGVTPQLTKGSLFAGADWNDPSVLKSGAQYVMYASSDHDFDGVVAIYRLVSTDGKVWALEPEAAVLAPSPLASAWDHKSVETPSVVWFRSAYHMFYTGYPAAFSEPTSYRIGHAVSNDGIVWTRDPQPLVAPTCPDWTPTDQTCSPGGAATDFHAFLVAEPGAVVFNDKIHLYFSASGYDTQLASPLMTVGLMTSSDATRWSAPQQALVPDQTVYPRSKWLGYSTPAAAVLGGQVHLFFDVVQETPFAQLALHHARSEDGVSGFVQDATAIFSSSSFAWTAREIRAPAPLLDGTELRLWFAGDAGGASPALGIGEAACAL